MIQAGGRSPQLSTIQAQAKALQAELEDRGVYARAFIAMRYWHPFAEDAIDMIKAEGIQKLVILPLYPQFSLSTSGSALRVLERMLYTDPGFPVKSSVVPAWYNRPGFLEATAKGIAAEISSLAAELQGKAHILYTAQGLPRKYVEDLSDPYQEQVERSIELVRAELAQAREQAQALLKQLSATEAARKEDAQALVALRGLLEQIQGENTGLKEQNAQLVEQCRTLSGRDAACNVASVDTRGRGRVAA